MTPTSPAPSDGASPPEGAPPGIAIHPIRFDGTGLGCFRVWLVNVVLMVLTFGLFTPWARRRTARWFYDHTDLAGSPLEFVAPIRRMVVGFLVFAAL